MSLIQSPPQLDTPWRHLIIAAGVAVGLPCGLGVVLLGLFNLLHTTLPTDAGILLWAAGMTLMLSPFVSLAAMVLVVPVASLLIRLGWFGWLPAGALGLGLGGVIGQMMHYDLAAPFGGAALLILRASLGLLRPMGRVGAP
ncbi:MAG: hypothetical protein JXR75_07865 [Rhodobacteraceae bacterium]|nr:hypothetical protein [Paracoccaceae bacterium]